MKPFLHLSALFFIIIMSLNSCDETRSQDGQTARPSFTGTNTQVKGSCSYKVEDSYPFCVEFSGIVSTQAQYDAVMDCKYQWDDYPAVYLHGVYSSQNCSAANVVHKCKYDWFGCSGNGCKGINTWSFYPPWNQAEAKEYCDDIP